MTHRRIIAIDPDVERSGVVVLDVDSRRLTLVEQLTFPETITMIQQMTEGNPSVGFVVVVEAGWVNHTNWHLPPRCNARIAAQIGNKTGRNHETGRKLVETLRFWGIDVVEQAPLRKCWKGKDGKITQGEIEQFIPDFPKRSKQDERDAALIAWNYAGFTIRIRV